MEVPGVQRARRGPGIIVASPCVALQSDDLWGSVHAQHDGLLTWAADDENVWRTWLEPFVQLCSALKSSPGPGRSRSIIIFALILGNIHLASLNINARNVYDVHAWLFRTLFYQCFYDFIIFSNCTLLLLLLLLIASKEQYKSMELAAYASSSFACGSFCWMSNGTTQIIIVCVSDIDGSCAPNTRQKKIKMYLC